MVDGRWSMVDDRWSMVGQGMGKSIGNFFCSILSCLFLFFIFFGFGILFYFFCLIKHGGALFNLVVPVCFFYFFWFCFFYFFVLLFFLTLC